MRKKTKKKRVTRNRQPAEWEKREQLEGRKGVSSDDTDAERCNASAEERSLIYRKLLNLMILILKGYNWMNTCNRPTDALPINTNNNTLNNEFFGSLSLSRL